MKRWDHFDFSQLETGPLYFYVGAGLSMGATGLVGWPEMACLIWWYRKYYENTDPEECPKPNDADANAAFLQRFVDETEGETSEVRILSEDSNDPRALGRTALLNLMLRYRAPRVPLKEKKNEAVPKGKSSFRERPGTEPNSEDLILHSLIWRSGCHGVLTTNYDMLLEHAYSLYDHGAALRSYRYDAHILRYLLSNPKFVLKLHGDINDIATMEFHPPGAWKETGALGGSKGEELREVYNAALRRGHMVYVGCGFRDRTIEKLHKGPQQPRASRKLWKEDEIASRHHCRIALVPEDICGTEEEISKLEADFEGIDFLTYEENKHEDLRKFLERIVGARGEIREPFQACPEASSIHRQLFLGGGELRVRKYLSTELWSCMMASQDTN